MRLAILTSLALLPALAHAATPAAADASTPSAYTDVVHTRLNADPRDAAFSTPGELATNFYGVSFADDSSVTVPQLTHVVGRTLPVVLIEDSPKAEVAVRVIVNAAGVPETVTIVHSAGAAIDASTLAAVRQYRFSPAKVQGVPVEADLTLDISLEKK
jgi:TonB family protein